MNTDEKKPPSLCGEVVAQITIDLLECGGARMVSSRPVAGGGDLVDAAYAIKPDREIPIELAMLIGELRTSYWLNRQR